MIKITTKEDCAGCYACYNICPQKCIKMLGDEEGFVYPQVDQEVCINCGLCEKACPVANKIHVNDNQPVAYAAKNKDLAIQKESSSGGVFSLIAEYVIGCGGVIFGASFDDNFNVVHSFVDSFEEIGKLRGSKYVQSVVGITYRQVKEFLEKGIMVLFVGTPCQLEGLLKYLDKPYNNLLTADMICHGVPSPKVWQMYRKYRAKEEGKQPIKISFRDKVSGWKGYSMRFYYENSTYEMPANKDYMLRAFLSDLCLRPSCYSCKFKSTNRPSDFTLADFWDVEKILPEFDDPNGVSLLLVNSPKGRDVFDLIKDKMYYSEVDLNQAIIYNSAAIESSSKPPKRDRFMKRISSRNFGTVVNKYCRANILKRAKIKIKSFLKKIKG